MVPSQICVIARSQLKESVQLFTGVAWVLVTAICPPKPLPQSLVTAKVADESTMRGSISSSDWPGLNGFRRVWPFDRCKKNRVTCVSLVAS